MNRCTYESSITSRLLRHKKRPLLCCKRAIVYRGTTSVCRALTGNGLYGYAAADRDPQFGYPALDNGRKPGETLLRYHPANRMPVQAAAGCAYSRVSPAALHHPAVLLRARWGGKPPFRYFFAVMALVDFIVKMRLACSIK